MNVRSHPSNTSSRSRLLTAALPGLGALLLCAACTDSASVSSQQAAAPKHEDKIVTSSGYADMTPAERRAEWLKASNPRDSFDSAPANQTTTSN